MIEKPIIFSGEMVRAILDGRKTMTRRLNKQWLKVKAGDRLWVKETWRVGAWDEDTGRICVDYRADGLARHEWLECADNDLFDRLWIQSTDDARAAGLKIDGDGKYHWKHGESPCRWRSSRYMPRWASRITLEATTDARLEKLQKITGMDVGREGFEWDAMADEPFYRFAKYWDSLNPRVPWSSNPEVVVIEFKRILP